MRPLISPAEARYALVAREMAESGDWIHPRLNHARFYEKPPLTYWAVAASYRLFGFTELASRLPSAMAYVGTTAVTYFLAAELLGAAAAPVAALIYATSLGPYLFGRFLFTDTILVFCLSVSLLGLARVVRRPESLSRAGPLLFFLGAGFAGLAKGLIGLLFPFAAASAYALLARDRDLVRRLRPGPGLAIAALVFVPWHAAMAAGDPSFLAFYFGNEHVARFLGHRDPLNYTPLSIPAFWISTALWAFPWILFLPSALSRRRRAEGRRALALAWIWVAVVVGFFTLTGSRLEYYALPAFPALAVILASGWLRFVASGRPAAAVAAPSVIAVALGLAAAPLVFLPASKGADVLTGLVASLDGYYREYFAEHPGASMVFGAELLRRAQPLPIVLLLLAAATLAALALRRRRAVLAMWVAGAVPILGLADAGQLQVAVDRSQRDAARIVNREWTPRSRLMVTGDYEDSCGITFYTGQSTQVIGGPGPDLLFGFRRGDAPEVFVTPDEFLRAWDSDEDVFVLGGRDLTLPGATVLLEGPRSRLLVGNRCPPEDDVSGSLRVAARSLPSRPAEP
ncbi:MAG TPA: glycosyltransferase family 39 protein [Thermoanaerobaculia bacterium]|nr:glycosyltransferase family 39 protein [Thermoanaerobaculia bacterium]